MTRNTPANSAPVHLVCNAHLDPVWLWEWEEGAAEAISTFRTAADCCDLFPGFIFNHNEAILYRWVEEFEPALFLRIQKLVQAGRWHVMGGWHLQPDCNMPSGESFVRQILLGRQYFKQKFGKAPTTAINFDPFGHSRGLVQILSKSGFDSYLVCRPGQNDCPLPADTFLWEGFDGSRVTVVRTPSYGSAPGQAHAKIIDSLKNRQDSKLPLLVLWGVGNHGGGPSRRDLRRITRLIESRGDVDIRHSSPEKFIGAIRRSGVKLPVFRKSLNRWAPGCYTSQVRIKQTHRALENELYATEKMCSAAWLTAGMPYPAAEFSKAGLDLATVEFHDVLPGSSIQPVEDMAIRIMHHALEELSRVKARAFFKLAAGQQKAPGRALPVLVYNPHPFPIEAVVECEMQHAEQNWAEMTGRMSVARVSRRGKRMPAQVEKELSNLALDWRKRVVFRATLEPSRMNRFDCEVEMAPCPIARRKKPAGRLVFRTRDLEVVVNTRTGLVDRYRCGNTDFAAPGAFAALIMKDDEDPWGVMVHSFRKKIGQFRLLSAAESARFAGIRGGRLPAVRVVEDGPVRTVVEALFGYGNSRICQRYKIPKSGTELEVELRVYWNEKDRMLKLAVPTPFHAAAYRGQVAYGAENLCSDGTEVIAQKWTAIVSAADGAALTCINNGSYGSDFLDGELRLTLLRSPAYSALPIGERERIPQNRFTERIDQGERRFMFRLNGGPAARRLTTVDREALAFNETPPALCFFPSGLGRKPEPLVEVDGRSVQVAALKKAEAGNDLVIRLFEPTGRRSAATVSLPFANMRKRVTLEPFELRTYRVDVRRKTWTMTDLLEKPMMMKGNRQ